jgi:hypothetical protein
MLETYGVVDADEAAGFVGVKAYGGIRFVGTLVDAFTVVAICKRGRGRPNYYRTFQY